MLRYSAPQKNASVYRNESGMTLGDVRRFAPSILTAEASPDRSDKYAAISTLDMVKGLREEGFRAVEIAQSKACTPDRREFARHVVRMRHVGGQVVAGAAHEVLLLNSHDGTSSFTMLDGWFRFVCSNGLVSGDIKSMVRIAHRGDAVERAREAATALLDRVRESSRVIEAMKQRVLTPVEYLRLAQEGARARWGDETPVRPSHLLEPRRSEDRGHDLWTVMNRIQENVIRGGTPGFASTGRRLTTRPVTSIDEDVRINRELWQAAESLLTA